jgi:hypothetical protein
MSFISYAQNFEDVMLWRALQQAEQRAARFEARVQEAETKARLAEATLQEVFSSRSWRVTQPLRWLAGTVRLLRENAKRLLKRLVAPLLVRSIRFAESHLWLKNVALRWLGKYPRLELRLHRFAAARGLIDASSNKTSNWSAHAPSSTAPQELMELPPRAEAISESPEFRRKKLARNESPFWYYASSFDAEEVIFRHAAPEVRPSSEHLTNYLGVRIRPHFLPNILSGKEGEVEPAPVPANWHADIAEWGACLRALDLAGDHFTMIELGCGWGCWMNILSVAARQSGRTFRLYGVEADEVHLGYAREALADNGIGPENYQLLRGIAGAASGTALFPLIASGVDWGGTALFGLDAAEMAARIEAGSHVEIPVADIPALVDEPVDLMHVDIQGAELALLTELYPYLCERVGYVMIGTHTREIEGGLIELFSRGGDWVMEMERGVIHRIIDGRPITICDGVQGWRNIGREARRAGE